MKEPPQCGGDTSRTIWETLILLLAYSWKSGGYGLGPDHYGLSLSLMFPARSVAEMGEGKLCLKKEVMVCLSAETIIV